jgi:ABC-type transport system involved in multi-copper enzyme maturation permease subunit
MIEKDFRALVPVWLAAVASVALSHAAGRNWEWLGVAAYLLGAPAVPAFVFGHEYTHRTIGTLLTLPVARWRIWLSKMVLAVLLVAPLTGVAMYVGPLRGGGDARMVEIALFTLTTLAGICLASWFTMLTRSPLAGTVFTVSLAGVLTLIGAWIGARLYGYTKNVDHFQVLFMWATLVPLCAFGLVLGWRTFADLEAPDGHAAAVHLELPRASAVATSSLTRRHPLVLLAFKELRLQQLAWTLALIYALLYIGLGIWRRGTQEADTLAQALTMFFAAAMAIVLGAVTTAEERQLGAHDANLLQPIPAWHQWTVKAGTALVSAVILTIVLPVVLVTVMPPEHMEGFSRRGLIQPHMIWLVAFVVAVSIYISALSQTTMRALVLTIAVLLLAAAFFQRVIITVAELAWRATHNAVGLPVVWPWLTRNQQFALSSAFIVGLLVMILSFAAVNHRRADRGLVRIALQVAAVALVAVAGFALAAALGIR